MSVIHGVNYGTPTLDLNFAKNKSLIDTASGRNLVTFTRAQTAREATYVGADGLIKTAVADEARFDHNPVTGECLGLLVEEARTNFSRYSEQFDNAWWIPSNASSIANAIVAPNGTLTGYKLTENTSNADHYILGNPTAPGPATFTSSVYLKAGERTKYFTFMSDFATGGVGLTADLIANTAVLTSTTGQWSNSSASITNAGNGWYRVSITSTLANSAQPRVSHYALNASAATTYTGDGVSGIYMWGAQVEKGSFPTSYIPTAGSTVTRTADTASITGTNFSNFFVQNTGSLFVDCSLQSSASAGQAPIVTVDASGANFRALSRRATLGARNTSNNDLIDVTSGVWNGEPKKIAFTWVPNDCTLVENGILVGTDTSTTLPLSTVDRMLIGANAAGGFLPAMGGRIARLTYYPTRLQDFQLQQLTK